MNMETFDLPLSEAAKRLNTTELHVLMHIKRKKLDGVEKDGQWYLSQQNLDDFVADGTGSAADVLCTSHHCGQGCGSCG